MAETMMMVVIVTVVMIVIMMMMVFDRFAGNPITGCVSLGRTHGDRVDTPCMRPAQVVQVAGGNLWNDDERRGETPRSEREWYQGDPREEREGRRKRKSDTGFGSGQRD